MMSAGEAVILIGILQIGVIVLIKGRLDPSPEVFGEVSCNL